MALIYLYEGQFYKGEKGNQLIKRAALMYCSELGIDFNVVDAKILREDKGKPYFENSPFEFSISHSGKLWMCAFSKYACGLDLQIEKECSFEKIAKSQYTKEEQHYVNLWGERGFFDVWVRKEAFVKTTGQGLFTKMPSSVDEKTDLITTVSWEGKKYYFKSIEIADDLKCALCMEKEEDYQLRIIG